MQNFSKKIDINIFPIIEEKYKDIEIDKTLIKNQYIYKSFVSKKFRIDLYTNGTLYLHGEDILEQKQYINSLLNIVNYSSIGSDEVGTGDIFGPIVICSVFLSEDNIIELEKLNVTDSKALNDNEIIKIAEQFLPKITHSALILDNKKYNEIVKTNNMNMIKAKMHNKAILNVKEKINDNKDKIEVILDQFCEPHNYFDYLKFEKKVYRNITFSTKAESKYMSVAMASIFARYIFIKKFEELEQKYQINLQKGSSPKAIEKVQEIYKKYGKEIFNDIAKTNFKTFEKLDINLKNEASLF